MKINYKSKTAAPWSFWLGLLAICLAFAMPSTVQAQCSTGTQYPTTTFTPVNNNLFASINGCNYAGEYAVVAVTLGNVYTFSTCAADGSNVTYDSQLTLRNNANTTTLAYSDDVCGLQSQFTWTATLTGNVRIYLHQYNCATNTTCSTIRVRRTSVAFNPCASFGTFSCGVATATNNTAGNGAWTGYGGPFGTPGQERILTFTPLVTGPHIFVTTNNNQSQDLFCSTAFFEEPFHAAFSKWFCATWADIDGIAFGNNGTISRKRARTNPRCRISKCDSAIIKGCKKLGGIGRVR